jgi:hypothetical protein
MEKRLDVAAVGSTPTHASKQIFMKTNLTVIEKVALSWTAPLMLVVFLFLSMVAIALFLLASFLNISGTIGAALYLIDQVKFRAVGFRLKKLIKKDEELHKFDSEKQNK